MKKERVKGRGPRVTEKELQNMLTLYRQGKTLKQIGWKTKRHWQTVRKYVRQALATAEGEEVRREALGARLTQHYGQLVDFVEVLKDQFPLPSSEAVPEEVIQDHFEPDRLSVRDRLLYKALRDVHAKDSPLWGRIEQWAQTAADYREACEQLGQHIEEESREAMQELAGVSFDDGFAENLFRRGLKLAFGHGSEPSLRITQGNDGWELWRGQSQRLASASSEEGAKQAQDLFHRVAADMETWYEVEQLKVLYGGLSTLLAEIEEDAETLVLRGAFPRRCDICPI